MFEAFSYITRLAYPLAMSGSFMNLVSPAPPAPHLPHLPDSSPLQQLPQNPVKLRRTRRRAIGVRAI